MSVYTLNPLNDSRWTDFVERHPRASIFHTPGWLEALQRTYGYEPVVYTTSAPADALTNGIVFCRVSSWLTGERMVSVPFADHCEPLVESLEGRKEILSSLQDTLDKENLKFVELRPLSGIALTDAGLRKDKSYCFHSLDLRPTPSELFGRFQKDSIQRKIRRAEREGVVCEEGRSEQLLKEFYRLFLLTRRRHSVPPPPIDWLRTLAACLGDRFKIHIASKAGHPIASIVTLRHGSAMIYKYGGSDETAHNLGGMPSLFWKAIQAARNDGALQFEFGRSDCDNAGLITFKDRLGSERTELTYWRLATRRATSPSEGKRKLKFAGAIFARMPDRLLAASGRFLYRHIG